MTQETHPTDALPTEPTQPTQPTEPAVTAGRDAASWAPKVDRLEVGHRDGVRGTNVAGRRLTGPVQGFGKMWQKTYSTHLGGQISPEQAIATWKAHFPDFWPKGNRFAGALAGISPGDVALLKLPRNGVLIHHSRGSPLHASFNGCSLDRAVSRASEGRRSAGDTIALLANT